MKTHQVDKLASVVYEVLQEGKDPYIIVTKEGNVLCSEPQDLDSTDKVIISPEKLRSWAQVYSVVKVVEKMQYVISKYK